MKLTKALTIARIAILKISDQLQYFATSTAIYKIKNGKTSLTKNADIPISDEWKPIHNTSKK